MKQNLFLFFLLFFSVSVFGQIEIYNWPQADSDILSDLYTVKVRQLSIEGNHGAWQDVTVLSVKPRAPYNHPIVGEQSSAYNITGDRITSFAPFGFQGPIEVEVEKKFGSAASRVEITPKAYGINPHYFDGKKVRFAINQWGYISVNFVSNDNKDNDGAGGTQIKFGLMLFADNLESEAGYTIPKPTDPGVVVWNNQTNIETIRNADIIYFPPGDHKMKEHKDNEQEFLTDVDSMEEAPLYHGQLRLKKSQKIYLAQGAYVRGCFNGEGYDNIWLYGRGVVSGRDHLFHEILIPKLDNQGNWILETATKEAFVDFIGCDSIRMDGVCIIEPFHHSCPSGSNGLIKNIKIMGFNYNNDGIRPGNGTIVDGIFIKTMDDYDYARGKHTVKNSVMWPMFNGSVGMLSWSTLGGDGWKFLNNQIINAETKNSYSNNDGIIGSQADYGIQTYNLEIKDIQIDHPITNLVDALILDQGNSTNISFLKDFRFINIKSDFPFQRTNGEKQLQRLKGMERNGQIAWIEDFVFTNFVVDGKLVTWDNYTDYFNMKLEGTNGNNVDNSNYVRNITFNTKGNLYTIDVKCGDHGLVFPKGNNGKIDCPEGTCQAISIQPDYGYKIKSIVIDGEEVTREQMHYFKNIKQNHTVVVEFQFGDDYFDLGINNDIFYRKPDHTSADMPGIGCVIYKGDFNEIPDFEDLENPESTTLINIGSISGEQCAGYYYGYINVPDTAVYNFIIKHNMQVQFLIGDKVLMDEKNQDGEAMESTAKIGLMKGKHAFQLRFNQLIGNNELELYWESGLVEQSIPPSSVFSFEEGEATDQDSKALLVHYNFEQSSTSETGKNNAELFGDPEFINGGASMDALNFDGQDDYLKTAPNLGNSFTLAFWLKTDQQNAVVAEFPNQTLLQLDNGKLSFTLNENTLVSTQTINNNKWRHIAISLDGETGSMALFIDGQKDTFSSVPVKDSFNGEITIGGTTNGSKLFKGAIDLFYLYNYPLSEGEIKLLKQFPGNVVRNPGFENSTEDHVFWEQIQNDSGGEKFNNPGTGVDGSASYSWSKGLQNNVSIGQSMPIMPNQLYKLIFSYLVYESSSIGYEKPSTFRTYFYAGDFDPVNELSLLEENETEFCEGDKVHTEYETYSDTITAPAGVDSLYLSFFWHKRKIYIDNVALIPYRQGSVASVQAKPELSVQVYPNPARQFITITGIDKGSLGILNLNGQTVLKDDLSTANQQVNISCLEDGVYLVIAHSESESFTTKLLVK